MGEEVSKFLELVKKERNRQIVEKGYIAEHDDKHTDGSLADAGACYAANHKWVFKPENQTNYKTLIPLFPWDTKFLKKDDHSRKQQLIIAAAFINAEYDRIVRAEKKDTRCRGCESLKGINPDTWCGDLGVPMDEYDTRCEVYRLSPIEVSEDNPILRSFMRSSCE